jgi:hypothetical protein
MTLSSHTPAVLSRRARLVNLTLAIALTLAVAALYLVVLPMIAHHAFADGTPVPAGQPSGMIDPSAIKSRAQAQTTPLFDLMGWAVDTIAVGALGIGAFFAVTGKGRAKPYVIGAFAAPLIWYGGPLLINTLKQIFTGSA